jgi:hypothetical protein
MSRGMGMQGHAYKIVADIIGSLPDDIRQRVADHFATEFNARSPSFDAGAWYAASGGTVLAGLAPSEAARAARVRAYMEGST